MAMPSFFGIGNGNWTTLKTAPRGSRVQEFLVIATKQRGYTCEQKPPKFPAAFGAQTGVLPGPIRPATDASRSDRYQ